MRIKQMVYRIAQRRYMHGRFGIGHWLNPFMRYWHLFVPYITARKYMNVLLAHMEMALGRAEVRSKPYMLRIEPTNICNLRCRGCSTGLGINPRPKGFLKPGDFKRILDLLAPYLLLTRLDGLGEPFLNPDLCELIRLAHGKGLATSLSSHLGPQTLKSGQAHEVVNSGLDHIIVSIDGPDQDTYMKYRVGGDFDTTCRHVRELVAAKHTLNSITPLIEIQFLGFNHNRHLVHKMPDLVKSLGADCLTCKLVHPEILKEQKAKDYKGHRCLWLYTTWTICWDGERKLCPSTLTDIFSMPNSFLATTDLTEDLPLMRSVRRFLAGDRNLDDLDPLLGDPASQQVPWRVPRGTDMCRCLACASTGMVLDRTRKWIDEYVCM